jgi:poly(A) polymerase
MEKKTLIDVSHPIFRHVADAANDLGIDAYAVGGYVRDQLLGRPCKDIDFVCVGSGIELAQKTAEKINANIHVNFFKNFGTAQFRWGDLDVEFVGARKESYDRGSRKPVVEDGTLEDDQNRRDFTINALAVSLSKDSFGELVDPFGGVAHLAEKKIITPLDPDITFSDDPLRMMRAIRFATQLDFEIDPITFDAIRRNAERINIISQERITEEFNKIILAPRPSTGFLLLEDSGLLKIIFPSFSNSKA